MPRELQLSECLYAALLRLYPASFRSAYGPQMRLTFRDSCRAAYRQHGPGGLLSLWFPTFFDLLKSALEERAQQGEITMLKERFVGLSGPLTIVVGALMMGGLVGDLVWLVRPSEPLWEFFHFGLPVISFVVMLPAFVATRLRYQEAAHSLGRLGLTLSVAGAGALYPILLAGYVLNIVEPSPVRHDLLNGVAFLGGLSILIGHILFGIDALRYHLLPRWNAAPLLVGLTFPLLVVLSMILVSALRLDNFELEPTMVSLQASITGLWWVLLGVAMMSRQPARESASAPHIA